MECIHYMDMTLYFRKILVEIVYNGALSLGGRGGKTRSTSALERYYAAINITRFASPFKEVCMYSINTVILSIGWIASDSRPRNDGKLVGSRPVIASEGEAIQPVMNYISLPGFNNQDSRRRCACLA